MKNIIRGVALVPGAIIASYLVTFPLHWILYFKFANNGTLLGFIELPSRSDISIEHTIYPFIMAITFILVGKEIAPRHKFKTAVILSSMYIITWLICSIIVSEISLRSILAVVGAVIGLYISKKQSSNKVTNK
jgi:hypothetical protein